MLYAVIAQTVLNRYYVSAGLRIGRTVPFPDIGVAVADRDGLLGTGLGRISRADFPPGRGFYIRQGVAEKIQVALPTAGDEG